MIKRAFALWLCLACTLFVIACADTTYTLNVSASSLKLAPGDSRTITWSVEPVNLVEHKVTWTSDNPYVASVDQKGRISAHAAGSTYIRATLETGTQRRITVTVTGNPVTELTLDAITIELEVGETAQLNYTMNPEADDKRVKWTSDDTGVATVDNSGKVTAVGGGVATVTLMSVNGMTATTVIYVPTDVLSVRLSTHEIEIGVGQTTQISAEALPVNARNREIIFESSDETVAAVTNDGVVTGISAGECMVRAVSTNGKRDIANVKVSILPDSMKITPERPVLSKQNRSLQLYVDIQPLQAADCKLTWTSSDESVIKVDAGLITAYNYGSAIISAEAPNGVSAEITVYVGETPESVRFNNSIYLLPLYGEDVIAYPVFSPYDSYTSDYVLSIEDEGVATVDENGTLHAVAPGTTTLTLTSAEGLSCTAEVRTYEDIKNLYTTETKLSLSQYELHPISFYSETGRSFTGQVSARVDDESVCVYSDGYIYARAPGNTLITFSNPGTAAACTVSVTVIEGSYKSNKVIALTFDNGPDEYTSDILRVLDKYNVNATFFLLGLNIERNPNTAALFRNTTHELGNHTYENSSLAAQSIASAANALEKTDRLAERCIGRELTLLRAPDALLPESMLTSLLDTRRFIGRGYDVGDALGQRSADEIRDLALEKAYNTSVLTFHDSGKNTAEALDLLIPELIKRGYRFVTISELIEYTGSETGIFSTVP